ncbi:predicted protein [Thalassiosira pseudonana CCMP1335]|uniref:Uncharacterized protein n=1 Tax=Thalassiosira pseudonana TaxID=35128 RepID=B8C2V6_THAPS|nr:predicted protein [Thalassiosira pseudonana CCMP1335]EED92015.1 predicted protein [Thalassiosira pseudonana CCMP1335]
MDNEQEVAPQAYDEPSKGQGDGDDANSEDRPAGMREWLMRFGAGGNSGRGPFGSLTTAKQVGTGMIYGSSALGAVNSPIVMYKERQLTKEDTFRAALNGIREQQGRLAEQNDILSAEIDDLESEVERMQDIEVALRELSNVQGTQINELLDLVRQNQEINEGMRYVLKSNALEEVISLVLDIDNDGSFTIQNKEIDRLIIGMKLIDEIKFNERAFRHDVIACGGIVDEVILIIKRMVHGSSEEQGGRETSCQIEIEEPEKYFQKQKSIRGSSSSISLQKPLRKKLS